MFAIQNLVNTNRSNQNRSQNTSETLMDNRDIHTCRKDLSKTFEVVNQLIKKNKIKPEQLLSLALGSKTIEEERLINPSMMVREVGFRGRISYLQSQIGQKKTSNKLLAYFSIFSRPYCLKDNGELDYDTVIKIISDAIDLAIERTPAGDPKKFLYDDILENLKNFREENLTTRLLWNDSYQCNLILGEESFCDETLNEISQELLINNIKQNLPRPSEIKRTIVLDPETTMKIFQMGFADKIVAANKTGNTELHQMAWLPHLSIENLDSNTKKLEESIIELQPDLIIGKLKQLSILPNLLKSKFKIYPILVGCENSSIEKDLRQIFDQSRVVRSYSQYIYQMLGY